MPKSKYRDDKKRKKFERRIDLVKVDEGHGLVLGYAVISKVNGEDYFDSQGDHAPEEAMLSAAVDFMSSDRVMGDMHIKGKDGNAVCKGSVLFAWPLTTDVAEAFGWEVEKTGLLIAVKPSDPEVLEKFKSGEYTGFSIGGSYIENEEVDDA